MNEIEVKIKVECPNCLTTIRSKLLNTLSPEAESSSEHRSFKDLRISIPNCLKEKLICELRSKPTRWHRILGYRYNKFKDLEGVAGKDLLRLRNFSYGSLRDLISFIDETQEESLDEKK